MPKKITILHLSDLQFGRHHRFAGVNLGNEFSAESLLEGLKRDLAYLRSEESLRPDLVIVTGDLVETGAPSEFKLAALFLTGLLKSLEPGNSSGASAQNLPLYRRLCIIPGNHDINWHWCRHHFHERAALEQEPKWPWWPKWKSYADFFEELYRTNALEGPAPREEIAFKEDQEWTVFRIPELKVVVAGLNSTMDEGAGDLAPTAGASEHPRRYPRHIGLLGRPQIEAMCRELQPLKDQGWLRIGAVHHNPIRGAANDNENLEDADLLRSRLGPYLNLLLHGHTHFADIAWLDYNAPILSTGSGGLALPQRPEEVPNQYQVLEIEPDGFRRIARAYHARTGTWQADEAVGRGGVQERWIEFADADQTFRQPRTSGAEGQLLGKPWITRDPVALQQVESIGRLVQREQATPTGQRFYLRPIHRKRVSFRVVAESLREGATVGDFDTLEFTNEFRINTTDAPVHCHLMGIARPERISRIALGATRWELKRGGRPAADIEVLCLPYRTSEAADSKCQFLLWFSPPLGPSAEDYEVVVRQEILGAMSKLMLGTPDDVSLRPQLALGAIDVAEVILEVPAYLATGLHAVCQGNRLSESKPASGGPNNLVRFEKQVQQWPGSQVLKLELTWHDEEMRRRVSGQCRGLARRLGLVSESA